MTVSFHLASVIPHLGRGAAGILDNGRFGELVPVGDDDALASAIERVLDAPPDRNALRAATARLSLERAAAQYERLIVDTLAARCG